MLCLVLEYNYPDALHRYCALDAVRSAARPAYQNRTYDEVLRS